MHPTLDHFRLASARQIWGPRLVLRDLFLRLSSTDQASLYANILRLPLTIEIAVLISNGPVQL